MSRGKSAACWVCVAMGCFSTAVQAQEFVFSDLEATAEAEMNFFLGSVTDSDQIEDPATELSAFADVGNAAAYQDLFGINAVFANAGLLLDDALDFSASARTHYDVRVKTPTEMTGSVPFQFVINGGELRIVDYSGLRRLSTTDFHARVSADITIFPEGFWQWTAILREDPFTGDPEVNTAFSLETLGVGFPAVSVTMEGEDAVVIIPHFEAEVLLDLDDFSFIGVFFTYDMEAELFFEDSLGASGLAGIGDPFGLSQGTGGGGIEFFLDGRPLSDFPVVIPEAAAGVLAAAGLGVLGLARRRGGCELPRGISYQE